MVEVADLLSLDRDVARAARDLAAWRRLVAHDPEAAAERDPFASARHTAGQSTYDALGRLTPGIAEEALRDALRRWVYALTQARIGLPTELERGRAASAEVARYEGDPPRLVSFREALRGLATARTAHAADLWLRAAAEQGPAIAAAERERRARRVEAARRLGIERADAPLVPTPLAPLVLQARAFLDATEDLAASVRREGAPEGGLRSPTHVFVAAMAREAEGGWPARLTARWLDERFGALAEGLSLALPPLPQASGAASFARAMFAFGAAFRVAASPRALPFSLAHEPWPVAAYRWGFAFAALATQPDFHRAGQGLTRRVALGHARHLAKTALLDARLHAARVLLADLQASPRDLHEELGPRLTGAALPPSLAGAWPAPREDEPARWLALLTARPMLQGLVDRFDVDWFRNPRVAAHLRSLAAGPAREPEGELTDEGSALARAFEEALG